MNEEKHLKQENEVKDEIQNADNLIDSEIEVKDFGTRESTITITDINQSEGKPVFKQTEEDEEFPIVQPPRAPKLQDESKTAEDEFPVLGKFKLLAEIIEI